jgi:hypothetical protein
MAAAQDERERALARERVALRRGQRALTVAAGLFATIIIGVTGLYYQNFLKEQYQWRVVMGASVLTAEQEREKVTKPGSDFKECANGCPTMIVVPAGRNVAASWNSPLTACVRPSMVRETTAIAGFPRVCAMLSASCPKPTALS